MKTLKKMYGGIELTWRRVLMLAVVSAVMTAVFLCLPFLKNTSFQDPGTYPDCWFLFAVFIIMNSRSWKEASLKCFIFFLISQPLIYLLQVPFSSQGWRLFQYYPRWFVLTVLTIPGAAIAYLLKRKDWLAAAVLAVANGYLGFQAGTYFVWMIRTFPHHLLSLFFCLLLSLSFVFGIFEDRKKQTASTVFIGLVFLLGVCFNFLY